MLMDGTHVKVAIFASERMIQEFIDGYERAIPVMALMFAKNMPIETPAGMRLLGILADTKDK